MDHLDIHFHHSDHNDINMGNNRKRTTDHDDSDDSSDSNDSLMFQVESLHQSLHTTMDNNNTNNNTTSTQSNSIMIGSNSNNAGNSPLFPLSPHGHMRKGRRLNFDSTGTNSPPNMSPISLMFGQNSNRNSSNSSSSNNQSNNSSQNNNVQQQQFKVPYNRLTSSGGGASGLSGTSSESSSNSGSMNFGYQVNSHNYLNSNQSVLSSSLPNSPISWGMYSNSSPTPNIPTNKGYTFPRPEPKAFTTDLSSSPSPSPPPTPTPKSVKKTYYGHILSSVKSSDQQVIEPLDFFKSTNGAGVPTTTSNISSPLFLHSKRQRSTSMSSSTPVNINPFTDEDKKDINYNHNQLIDGADKNIVHKEEYSLYNKTFQQLNLMGEGSFGMVFKCRHRIDGCLYAVKKTKKPLRGEKDRQIVLREVFGLAAIKDHANIVRYYNAWEEDNHIFIQMEYCNGGNIYSWVANRVVQSETTLLHLAAQVLKGLIHIHSLGLVHLDVKPENIYISQQNKSGESLVDVDMKQVANNGGENVVYKLGDLGLLNEATNTKIYSEGDSRYLSRELLHDDMGALKKSDIFSLGCTLYELARCKPLPKCGDEWNSIRNGELIETGDFSQNFWNFLRLMINPDPKSRPSSEELYNYINLVFNIGDKNDNQEIKRLKELLMEKQNIINQQNEQMNQLQVKIQHQQNYINQIDLKNMAL